MKLESLQFILELHSNTLHCIIFHSFKGFLISFSPQEKNRAKEQQDINNHLYLQVKLGSER